MIKKLVLVYIFFFSQTFAGITQSNQVKAFVIDHFPKHAKKSYTSLQAKQQELSLFFSPTRLTFAPNVSVVTDPLALVSVAQDTLRYLEHAEKHAPGTVRPPVFDKKILSTDKVKQTLKFIIDLIEQDKETGNYRILDPDFINQNFGVIKWHGDEETAREHGKTQVKDGKILLTHYVAFCCNGSYRQTKQQPYALYKMLGDHQPFLYTKQKVLTGVLSSSSYKDKVKPLVWLSREDLESVMLQGLGFITMPDGKVRLFHVHVHNNIPYDQTIKKPSDQRRYWYFKETQDDAVAQQRESYEQRKDVIFAGDVYNIGIGKLVLLTYQNLITRNQESRLGIIADTGAAFHNNLYQLDTFVGMVSSHQQLRKQVGHMLDTVNAYIIYKKEKYV